MDGRSEEISRNRLHTQGQRYDVVLATKGNHAVGEGPNEWQVSARNTSVCELIELIRWRRTANRLYRPLPDTYLPGRYVELTNSCRPTAMSCKLEGCAISECSNFAGYQLVDALWHG